MARKKLTPESKETCRPKAGETYCVKARHADGTAAHRHFSALEAAKRFERELGAEHLGHRRVAGRPATVTFEDYCKEWLEAQDHTSPETVTSALKRTYPHIGSTRLGRIDGLALQRCQKALSQKYARSTVELSMHYMKAVLRQAVADALVSTDPTARLKMPRRDPRDSDGVVTAKEVPTHAEALAILAGSPADYRLGIALGLGCGLRVGEVTGLTPSRVDLQAGTITVDRQLQRRGLVAPKTWRSVRTIPVPEVVLFELRRALKGKATNSDEPILLGGRNAHLRRDAFYRAAWHPALKGAGLAQDAYKFHAARHYCVSAMLGRGVPLAEVAAYVGDTIETVSRVYSHWLRDAPPAAKLALDQALAPAPQPGATGTDQR